MTRTANDRDRALAARREPTDDRSEQDGDEGRAFHQRIAGGQVFAFEMIRQNTVLDRPE